MQHLATLGLGFAAYIRVSVLHVVYLSCLDNSIQYEFRRKAQQVCFGFSTATRIS